MEVSVSVLSLDAPLAALDQDGEESSLADLLEDHHAQSPAEEAEHQELVFSLSSSIERLPQREQLLLSLYYQEELTMKEISKVLGISESRVCQLHMQALMRMRGTLSSYHAETLAEANVGAEAMEAKKQPVRRRDVVTIGRNTRQRIS